jgi:hypothetical protein
LRSDRVHALRDRTKGGPDNTAVTGRKRHRLKNIISAAAALICISAAPDETFGLGCFQGGCDLVWQVNKRFDDGLRSKSESLVGPAKQAFIEAMNVLFDDKLKPFIAQIDAVATGRLSQFDRTVKDAEAGIDAIVTHAGIVASSAVGQGTDQIKTKIIDESFLQADVLVDKVTTDINNIIENVDCKIDGQRDKLVEWWRSIVPFANPLDHCYRDNGATIFAPAADDYIKKYRIQECLYKDDLTLSKSVRDVKDNYARLLLLVRRFACITNQTPEAQLIINRDGAQYHRDFEVWWLMSQ